MPRCYLDIRPDPSLLFSNKETVSGGNHISSRNFHSVLTMHSNEHSCSTLFQNLLKLRVVGLQGL